MNTKILRQKILDLAIRGKLVPQNTEDGNAQDLLESIRAEKEPKIAKGELKSEKNASFIQKDDSGQYTEYFADGTTKDITTEIPFEIPQNWAWCRLGEVCDYGKCQTINTSDLKDDDWILDLEDIEKDTGKILDYKTFKDRNSSSTKHIFYKKQLLYSKLRPYLNKVLIAPKNGFCTSEILPLSFYGDLSIEFLHKLLRSPYFLGTVNSLTYGVKMPRLGTDQAKNILIPLPSLAEQIRIVEAIENFNKQIEIIEENQTQLQTTAKYTKSKILDLAIRGKLVSQCSTDESATTLLEKIRLEKETKIAKGELKRDKNSSFIFKSDDGTHYEQFPDGTLKDIQSEIPFDIPNNWAWCRLGELCTKLVDGDHNPPTGEKGVTEYIMASSTNINENRLVDLDKVRYLSKQNFKKINERTKIQNGDILFTTVGTLGRSCIYNQNLNITFQRSVTVITTVISNKCLKLFLDSNVIQNFIEANAKGTAQRGFYINQMSSLLIPLPPLAEQKRIVEAIENIMTKLEVLE